MKTNSTPRGGQKGISDAKSTPRGRDNAERELLPWHLKKQSAHVKLEGGILEFLRRLPRSIAVEITEAVMEKHGLKEIPKFTPEGKDEKS